MNKAIFIFIKKMFLYLLTSRKIYIAFNVLDIQLLFFLLSMKFQIIKAERYKIICRVYKNC